MKVCLLDCDYVVDGNKPVVRIFGVTHDGKSFLGLFRGFKPYFYARPGTESSKSEIEKLSGVERCDISEKELNGTSQRFVKITCFLPSDVPQVREAVKSLQGVSGIFEYDILFHRRFMIDNSIYPLDWLEVDGEEFTSKFSRSVDIRSIRKADGPHPSPKVLAFDIETFEENGENIAIMISVFAKGVEKVLTYKKCEGAEVVENEKAMITRFLQLVREEDPDVIVTYNGDGFDFPVLRSRFEKLKVPFILSRDGTRVSFDKRAMESSAKIAGRVHIDLYRFVSVVLASQMQSESLTLDAVSNELLGEKKMGMKYDDIRKAWTGGDLEDLCKYSLHDSYLTFSLAELLLPQTFEIARIAGQPPFDTSRMTYGQLVEWFLVRKAYPKMMVPNRPKYGDIQERRGSRYEGGFVREPIPGLHEKIAVMDFKSLYPSLIVSYNIDPSTLNCSCCDNERIPGFDRWFCTKKTGFIPSLIKELVETRAELKKRLKSAESAIEKTSMNNRQYALKIIANSIYGYYGYAGARWYSRECAESATALGRSWVQRVMGEAEKAGFAVIYGDTDSLMIKGDGPERFLDNVNKELPGIMELNLEGVYERGLFVSKEGRGTKKRYALIDSGGKLTIRGFEVVRRDWCELAKKIQKDVLVLVLRDRDVKKSVEHVKSTIADLKAGKIEARELVIMEQLVKPIESYEQIGPHVIAAKKLKERGRVVKEGSLISYVITKGKGSISERSEPFEYVPKDNIDYDYYTTNQIIPVSLRVLSVLGVTEEDLIGGKKQTGLGKFF